MLPCELQDKITQISCKQLMSERRQNKNWNDVLSEMEVYHSLKQKWNLGHVKMIPQCTKGHYFNLPDAQKIKYHTFIFGCYIDLEKKKAINVSRQLLYNSF